MSGSSAITVENVSKTFRIYHERNRSLKAAVLARKRASFEEFWALRDVSLEIPEGQTFGLLGNNGSGKSTLLKCIARILEPNRGSITRRGRIAAMLEVGSGFHPELSGRENVYLNGSILGMAKAEIDRKFDSIVDFAGVSQFIDQPVKNYSSGMYVRLGFSVSIHIEPDILLVDEVLAVGDMQFQERCMEKFSELKRDGRTVVVVSHGLDQMRTFCDQAAWLDHGVLQGVGPANDVITRYFDEGHQARPVEGGGTRYGSGEILISRIELISPTDGATDKYHTGDAMTMRLHYEAHQDIPTPIFIANIEHVDGHLMWAHTSKDGHYIPDVIKQGTGSIDVEIPKIMFRPATFNVSASVHQPDGTIYDALQRTCKFTVIEGHPIESAGLVTLDAKYTNLTPPRPLVPAPRV